MKEPSIPKSVFPRLLSKLIVEIQPYAANNIKSGFCKAGIIPIGRNKVLDMIPNPEAKINDMSKNLDESICDLLKQMRYSEGPKKKNTGKFLWRQVKVYNVMRVQKW